MEKECSRFITIAFALDTTIYLHEIYISMEWKPRNIFIVFDDHSTTLRQYESGANKRTLHAFVWLTFGEKKREKIRYTCIKRTGGKIDRDFFFSPSPPGFCNNLNLFELVENWRVIDERKRLKNICQLFGNIYYDFRSDFRSLYKVDIDCPSHTGCEYSIKMQNYNMKERKI